MIRLMPDGVEQMRLPQADPPVDEQRVVGPGGQFGHGLTGGLGELIRGPDDKGIEGVAGIEAFDPPPDRDGRSRYRSYGG